MGLESETVEEFKKSLEGQQVELREPESSSSSSKASDFVKQKLQGYKLDKDIMPAGVKARDSVTADIKNKYENKTGLDTKE